MAHTGMFSLHGYVLPSLELELELELKLIGDSLEVIIV
jgi:hypothetical protein